MSIIYDPKALLKRVAPETKIKRLVSRKLDFKRAALSFIDSFDFIDKKAVSRIALKTVRDYQQRAAKEQVEAGFSKEASEELERSLAKNPRQLIQRVQNEVVWQVSKEIKSQYGDEMARWLPSDADEPDPEHQANYGKVFKISEGINGEIPGERIGCRCGIEILTDETELKLE